MSNNILELIKKNHPSIEFVAADYSCWSPKSKQIFYNQEELLDSTNPQAVWALLHEVGHALLNHQSYKFDVELLKMEVEAWEKATEIAAIYNIKIDPEHVQDCIDTYRDWLHQRSTCPECENRSIQQDKQHYKCFNCSQIWTVSNSRFCRPYRKKLVS